MVERNRNNQMPKTIERKKRGGSSSAARCYACGSKRDAVDICDRCNKEFGDICKTDGNGYNCTCQHCGNNTYTTQCPDCDAPEQA